MNHPDTLMTGVCTPICTVFTEDGGRIDERRQTRHLDNLLEAGVDIICVCGGTGEFSFLTRAERLRLTALVARHLAGQARLIVHVSAVMTEETIEYARHAEDLGADCLLVLPPYFEGPTLEGTFEHYEKVADSVAVDIMAYNIPVHSGIDLDPDFVCRLMQIPNIRYLKDSTGDFLRIQRLVCAGVRVFNGADPLMLHSLMAGAAGCFWGTSNAIPVQAATLHALCASGRWTDAIALWRTLFPVNDFVWRGPFNPSVKALGNMLGHDLGECRRPVQPLTHDQHEALGNAAASLQP